VVLQAGIREREQGWVAPWEVGLYEPCVEFRDGWLCYGVQSEDVVVVVAEQLAAERDAGAVRVVHGYEVG
jgi:hypothetical protein